MRYGTKVVAIGVLIVLVAAGGALAVGFERYSAEASSDTQIKANGNGRSDFCVAVKKATFLEKVPAVLDEAADVIKDVLAQFGLAQNKAR
jgi:hypothetical protein